MRSLAAVEFLLHTAQTGHTCATSPPGEIVERTPPVVGFKGGGQAQTETSNDDAFFVVFAAR